MDVTKKALSLPQQAQEQLAAALTQASEGLMAILDLVKTATADTDPNASVPVDFAKAIKDLGMMIAALGDQYLPRQEGTPQAGAPVDPGMALSPEEMSMANTMLTAEEMAMAKTLSAPIVKSALKTMKTFGDVTKGRLKMSFDNALKVQSGLMAKLFEIIDEVMPLLIELGGEAPSAILSAAAGGAGGAGGEAAAPAAKALQPIEAKVDGLNKALAEMRSTLNTIAKSRNPSNAAPLDGSIPVPSEDRIPYGENLSTIVKASLQKQNDVPKQGA